MRSAIESPREFPDSNFDKAIGSVSHRESVSLHLEKKREKTTKTPPQQKPYI
jgi:hypothetical protein